MPWTIPAIVFLIVAALRGDGSGSLADAALRESIRRALMPPTTRSLTMADLPAAAARPEVVEPDVKPAEPAAKEGEPPAKEPELTESDWRAKMTAARDALERDQVLAEAVQSRINSLTTDSITHDDPAQRAELLKQRSRALSELDRLTLQITKDKLAIAAIEEDARKKNIPPGWIR